jgi:deoxyribodipyrimidine photo-lyase
MNEKAFVAVQAAPTRAAAFARLGAFVPRAGRAYACARNHDRGAGAHSSVSMLSPYVRHRLITEAEILAAVRAKHSDEAAEKFIQEVCWRTYWKGWLELRPAVWQHYQQDLQRLQKSVPKDGDLAARLAAAQTGATGVACMDAWAHELVATGYLHNHARMWFASIWIYTLKLPWQLGADFFMRHLLDGDPASNTLSWRWVCGLQTAGKTYLARASNIEDYTDGRFAPHGQLARDAPPLDDTFDMPKPERLTRAGHSVPGQKTVLVLTEDDLSPETWPVARADVAAVVGLRTSQAYPGVSEPVARFKNSALADAIARSQDWFGCPVIVMATTHDDIDAMIGGVAAKANAVSLTTMAPPVGPTASAVLPILGRAAKSGYATHALRRDWDELFWPYATHGFFKLKEKIPGILAKLDTERAPQLPLA